MFWTTVEPIYLHRQYSLQDREEGDMHRDDLMKPDLLSEILLVASGVLILLTLIFFLVLALAPRTLA
jgi:hypothetical protein